METVLIKLISHTESFILPAIMVEGKKDIPIQRDSEEIKREMTEYFNGPELTEEERNVRKIAFFNNFDERKYKEERYSLVGILAGEIVKGPKQDVRSTMLRESDLRILEKKTALLEREIEHNLRIPGYEEAYYKFDGFCEDLIEACFIEVRAKYTGMDEEIINAQHNNVFTDSLGEVHDALIKGPNN